jgi:hypothetical protein
MGAKEKRGNKKKTFAFSIGLLLETEKKKQQLLSQLMFVLF